MTKKIVKKPGLKNWKVTQETLHAVNDEVQSLTKSKQRQVTQAELAEMCLRCYREYKILHDAPRRTRKFDPRFLGWHTLLEEILTCGIPRYASAIVANLQGWGEAARAKGAKISDPGDVQAPPDSDGNARGADKSG